MCRTFQVFNWSVRLLTWRRDVERYTTDLGLGVAEPVVAIREGFFTCRNYDLIRLKRV
jgi:hypothetical protein